MKCSICQSNDTNIEFMGTYTVIVCNSCAHKEVIKDPINDTTEGKEGKKMELDIIDIYNKLTWQKLSEIKKLISLARYEGRHEDAKNFIQEYKSIRAELID